MKTLFAAISVVLALASASAQAAQSYNANSWNANSWNASLRQGTELISSVFTATPASSVHLIEMELP